MGWRGVEVFRKGCEEGRKDLLAFAVLDQDGGIFAWLLVARWMDVVEADEDVYLRNKI